MKQIIWIFGTSAAGKETFIRSILTSDDIKKALGIKSQAIAVSQESLKNLGKLDGSRKSIFKEIESLVQNNDVVLLKWQYGDSQIGTPEKMYEIYPNYKHRIIALDVLREDQVDRLKTKIWWYDKGAESDFLAKETIIVEEVIEKLSDKFEVSSFKW